MSFDDDMGRIKLKLSGRHTTVFRKVALELFGRIIMRTPVDTGKLRGNWQAVQTLTHIPELDRLDNASPSNEGGAGSSTAKDDAETVVLGADPSAPLYLLNSLPYARPIEYGHSDQAPAGMVRVSVAEFQDIARIAVRGLRDD